MAGLFDLYLKFRHPIVNRRKILIREGLIFLLGMQLKVFGDQALGFFKIAFEAFVAGEIVGDGIAGGGGEHGEAAEDCKGI